MRTNFLRITQDMLYSVENMIHFVENTYSDNLSLNRHSSMECILELNKHLTEFVDCIIR